MTVTDTRTGTEPNPVRHAVDLPRGLHSAAVARHITARWLAASTASDTSTETGTTAPGTAPSAQGAAGASAADAVTVVSELVTNTVRHTEGPCVLTLTLRAGLLDIAVSDDSEAMPDLHRHGTGGERGGFGLEIVRGLGGAITVVPRLGGKTVHVVLVLRQPAGAAAEPP